MKLIPFFTPIWTFELAIDFNVAVETCLDLKKQNESVHFSNRGGYQSSNFNFDHFSTNFPEIVQSMAGPLTEICDETKANFKFGNYWINVNEKHSYNILHDHPDSALSAVIYLKTNEKSGNIFFKNPTNQEFFPIDSTNGYFYGDYSFIPSPGTMLVFPSYLKHHVEQNLSDEDRISIAINFGNFQSYG
jgi:hypothetical protein